MYKIAWCPLCEQGWVVIVKDKQTSQLYAYCTECETEWNDPAKGIKEESCLPFGAFGQFVPPTFEEISKSAGTEKVWNKDKKLYEDVRLFSKDRLKHFEMGEALFLSQRRHPYFTKLQPYDAYKFYKGGLESKYDYIDKPPIKYYGLADDFFNKGIENWITEDSETNVIGL